MSASAGPSAEDPFAHTRMTLGEHLDELRKRLFRGVLALGIAFFVSLTFHGPLTEILLQPHRDVVAKLNAHYLAETRAKVEADPSLQAKYFEPDGTFRFLIDERLSTLSPTEAVWFVLKVAGYAALFFGSPVLLWQLWQFIAAGLYPRERRFAAWFFPPALLLFLTGVLFSYFVIVPYGMFYSIQIAPIEYVRADIRLGEYFGFLASLCLSMGAVFQLPILMTFVGRVGMVEPATFARLRGHFVIAAFVLAAVLTPGTDLFSQVAMAGPMILLYEVGILGARLARRAKQATP